MATCTPELARAPPAHLAHAIKHLLGRNDFPSLPTGAVFKAVTSGWKAPEPIANLPDQLSAMLVSCCGQSGASQNLPPATHKAQTEGWRTGSIVGSCSFKHHQYELMAARGVFGRSIGVLDALVWQSPNLVYGEKNQT